MTATPPPIPVIGPSGITIPEYNDYLAWAQAQYQAIYGADVVLTEDTQDGQMMAIFALACSTLAQFGSAVFNSFSPAKAQGAGLQSLVKINGLTQKIASNSTVDLVVGGQVGSEGVNLVVTDANGVDWNLPPSVVIPLSGAIIVTATCSQLGAISAPEGTVTKIKTPTFGIQTVNNPEAAALGNPVENDAALRQRQALSTAVPAVGSTGGLRSALLGLPGVTVCLINDNDSPIVDDKGIPGHCIAVVIEGGDVGLIANTVYLKKGFAGTYGSTSETVTDEDGVPHAVSFFRPAAVNVAVAISLKALPNFTIDIQNQIAAAVAAWISGLGCGASVMLTRLYVPANLSGGAGSQTFELTAITLSAPGITPTPDIAIPFNMYAACVASAVTFTVT